MKQVTIIGLGLIGASLGLALKQLKNPPRVIGHDIQYDAATKANKIKAVDKVDRYLPDAVAGSDLVLVATPVGAVPEVFKSIADTLPDGCIVSDTGSTKREILREAEKILPSTVGFVGGHPMTGKLTGGVAEPKASLFQNAVYCLVPSVSAPPAAVDTMARLVQQIGAYPYFTDSAEHDGLVAGISHLPYLLSVALTRALADQPGWREMAILAAGGFDSATRLSGHDPKMYADILATNRDNVARHIDALVEELEILKAKLLEGDGNILGDLEKAQEQRIAWEEQKRKSTSGS